MQLRDAVRVCGEPQGERGQAEAVGAVASTEPEQRLVGDAGLGREIAGVAEDELVAEHLVSGRNRRVGREDRRAADVLERVVGRQAALDEHARALDREERRVALVHVEHGRLEPERRERAHAADPEKQLLADPVLAVARVERVGEQVDVEQIERHATPDVVAPHVRGDRLACEVDLDRHRLAVQAERLRVDGGVRLGLAALVAQALREVTAAIEQPDADERQAELRCGLEVVAGEDAEPARVDRQVHVDAELHAEVRDEHVVPCVRAHQVAAVSVVCSIVFKTATRLANRATRSR